MMPQQLPSETIELPPPDAAEPQSVLEQRSITKRVAESVRQVRPVTIAVFLGVLLANLLNLLASAADAGSLYEPILNLISPAPQIQVVGSNTILGDGLALSADWSEAFQNETATLDPWFGAVTRSPILIFEGVGTIEGFRRALNEPISLVAASESPYQGWENDLIAQGRSIRCAAEVGYDVIAFVTHLDIDEANRQVRPLSITDLQDILLGETVNWSELGGRDQPITVLVRAQAGSDGSVQETSGTTDLVLRELTGSAEWRSHFVACPANGECLDRVLRTPGAITFVSSAWLRTQPPRYLKTLPLKLSEEKVAQSPLQEDFDPDNYLPQLIRPLYMYALAGNTINQQSSDVAAAFLNYVRGRNGQQILERHHFYTFFEPPAALPVQLPAAFQSQPGSPPVECQ